MSSEKKIFPMVPLRGITILPEMILHFDISRKKSIAAVEKAMMQDQQLFLVTQINPDEMEPTCDGLYKIGVIAEVKQLIKQKSGQMRVIVEGKQRAALIAVREDKMYLEADVEALGEEQAALDTVTEEGMCRIIRQQITKYVYYNKMFPNDIYEQLLAEKKLNTLLMQTGNCLPMDYTLKQSILEEESIFGRYEIVTRYLVNEIEVLRIKEELVERLKEAVDKNQRDYIMREQIKVLRKELGEEHTETDGEEFLKQVENLKAGKEVKEKIKKEIKRFQKLPSNSSESSVMRTYIETVLELPWNKRSKERNDIIYAQEILNKAHYGLEEVKERILEFLAVRAFAADRKVAPVLCLVGPPGTGKTSIAKSVAEALNKKYVRICLGGVRDEAEIRGHRKTYIGAMPGRIVKGLKQAGVKNPVMLLDEIDKLGNDYKGDPASAMLEVLDTEQNVAFSDHYVEIPIDLSEVLFIATANSINTIPRPLLDRMELIEVHSYTENEKFHIAKEHLLGKQLQLHGLTKKQFQISDRAIQKVICSYTKEAGVRSLERQIESLCRKAVKKLLEEERKSQIKITEKNLASYLGKEKYRVDMANSQAEIGIVRGLAWTSVGGDTLEIEVNVMPGKGHLKLTGKLGDVMKESAMTALSYVRSVADHYQISQKFFEKNDIHVHVPEGAVPKDGPSAGVTMALAILSAAAKIPVRADIAMTGEITLRGRVLPIGGLKEKILAAKTAGIKTVCIPEKNRADIDEISDEILKGMECVFVEKMEQIAEIAWKKDE